MDDRALELAAEFVSSRYIDAGRESLQATARTLRSILAQRRCPDEGLADPAIELILRQLAMMDTNNFASHVGGGEREGRVVSSLVQQRHFHLTHGIGRSGDLVSEQPKAAGSSLLYQLTNVLVLDLIRLAGAPTTAAAVVVPMATGMTLALVLRCVAKARVKELAEVQTTDDGDQRSAASAASPLQTAGKAPASPQYVIWPRIDQKTALKCIDAAGLLPYPVQLRPAPSFGPPSSSSSSSSTLFVHCEVDDIVAAVEAVGGPRHVVCVLSTTSCFAPRLPDNTVAIAQYCKRAGIPYVVNNAYGVQSRRIMTRLDAAQRLGRVDFFVQSGDKNFLVPVGGSVVCSSSKERCQAAAALYAGRASISPVVDLFITALSLGRQGMQALWAERYRCRSHLIQQLRVFAQERGETLLVDDAEEEEEHEQAEAAGGGTHTPRAEGAAADNPRSHGVKAESEKKKRKAAAEQPRNDISVAVTMQFYKQSPAPTAPSTVAEEVEKWTAARALGAQLFRSAVTGPRVVFPAPTVATVIAGCTFHNYGMHQEGTPSYPLLVIACGIGMAMEEVDALMRRLRELWPAASA